MQMKFTVPEFEEDKEHWAPQTFKDGPRGLYYHKDAESSDLVAGPIADTKQKGMLIGSTDYYQYRSKGHMRVQGRVLKIFGVRMIKWWGFEDEEFPMRIVWNGKQWIYCKPGVVKIKFEIECKGEGVSAWAFRVRMRVVESEPLEIFKVIIERDAKDKEGKVRLRD